MITISRPALLAELVERLDDAVQTNGGATRPNAVGAALRPFLGRAGLLTPEQEAGDPNRYRTHLLHVPDDGAERPTSRPPGTAPDRARASSPM